MGRKWLFYPILTVAVRLQHNIHTHGNPKSSMSPSDPSLKRVNENLLEIYTKSCPVNNNTPEVKVLLLANKLLPLFMTWDQK